jgi:hypothetical protein
MNCHSLLPIIPCLYVSIGEFWFHAIRGRVSINNFICTAFTLSEFKVFEIYVFIARFIDPVALLPFLSEAGFTIDWVCFTHKITIHAYAIEQQCYQSDHRISIPAYTIEQEWWQLGDSKNEMSLMSFIYKMMLVLYQSGVISGYISNIFWHASKWSSISFSHWQCPSDREFSFPRFVDLLILSLWVRRSTKLNVINDIHVQKWCSLISKAVTMSLSIKNSWHQ